MNLVDKLKELVKEWKEEAGFLNGPEDSVEDQYAGLAYGECAAQLTKLVQIMEEQEIETFQGLDMVLEKKETGNPLWFGWYTDNPFGLSK